MLRSQEFVLLLLFFFYYYLSHSKWKCGLDAVGSALNLVFFANVVCYLGFHSIHTAFC